MKLIVWYNNYAPYFNIEKNILLTVEQLGLISMDYFNNNLIVVNNVGDELYDSNSGFSDTIFLLLKEEHYCHIDIKNIKKYKKCSKCNKLFLNDHNFNNDRIEYYHLQIKKDVKYLKIESNTEHEEIDYINDILYFYFETFQGEINYHVYAVGYILNGKYNYFYGKKSLKRF